jgi:hypothetical protein
MSRITVKPAMEERLFSLGCMLVLVGTCVTGYLAVTSHWMYAAATAGLIFGWRLVCRIRSSRDRCRHLEALSASFSPSGRPFPRLTEGTSYGFRTFTLTFRSEAELRQAEASGCIAAFKQAIQSLYGHTGGRQNPFDADRAVWATHEGWGLQGI